jgi:hypothetical protein
MAAVESLMWLLLFAAGNLDSVWADHCRDESGLLSTYANAMHRLATDFWPQRKRDTRIDWCRTACLDYFLAGGLQKARDKSNRRETYKDSLKTTLVENGSCISGWSADACNSSGDKINAMGSAFQNEAVTSHCTVDLCCDITDLDTALTESSHKAAICDSNVTSDMMDFCKATSAAAM